MSNTRMMKNYIVALAAKHIYQEKLMLDDLAERARVEWGTGHVFEFDEQGFRVQKLAEWRAFGTLLELSPFRDIHNFGHREDDSIGHQIEKMRVQDEPDSLDEMVDSALNKRAHELERHEVEKAQRRWAFEKLKAAKVAAI
jgi:hypothetical protein